MQSGWADAWFVKRAGRVVSDHPSKDAARRERARLNREHQTGDYYITEQG